MEASRVLTPEVQEVTTTALAVPDQARAIVVTDNASYAAAAELLITIKGIRRKIEDTFKPIKQKMDAAKKEVLDQERAADAPLRQAEDYLKPQLAKWDAEQERIRREEEARLREEARKREEEARLQAAIEAEKNGQKDEAEAILDEKPAYVPPVVLPKATPKVQGISYRDNWKFRITNPNKIPREYMVPDEKAIGVIVGRLKERCNIPGIEVYCEKVVAAGRR